MAVGERTMLEVLPKIARMRASYTLGTLLALPLKFTIRWIKSSSGTKERLKMDISSCLLSHPQVALSFTHILNSLHQTGFTSVIETRALPGKERQVQ
jgi:hypothetical protein